MDITLLSMEIGIVGLMLGSFTFFFLIKDYFTGFLLLICSTMAYFPYENIKLIRKKA